MVTPRRLGSQVADSPVLWLPCLKRCPPPLYVANALPLGLLAPPLVPPPLPDPSARPRASRAFLCSSIPSCCTTSFWKMLANVAGSPVSEPVPVHAFPDSRTPLASLSSGLHASPWLATGVHPLAPSPSPHLWFCESDSLTEDRRVTEALRDPSQNPLPSHCSPLTLLTSKNTLLPRGLPHTGSSFDSRPLARCRPASRVFTSYHPSHHPCSGEEFTRWHF